MSYALVNPPPTGVPLSIVAVANENTAYASGGGGGSATPNPSFSSVTLIAGGQINLNASATQFGTLNLEYNSTLNLGSQIAFQNYQGPSGFVGMGYNRATSTIGVYYVSETGGPNGDSGMSMGLANISSLSVSSINGAAPGGAISSFNVLTTNQLVMGDSGGAISGVDVTATGNLVLQNFGTAPVNDIELFTNTVFNGTNASGIIFTAPGNINSLTVASANDNNCYIFSPSTISIVSQTDVSISSMSVSSINGAAPSGSGVAPAGISTNQVAAASGTKLTLVAVDGGTTLGLDNATDTITLDASIVDATSANLLISSINGAAPGGGGAPPANTSTIVNLTSLSTINAEAAPTIVNNDQGGWLSYGAISGGWGTWNGNIQLNQTGGALNSTFQIAPTVHFDGSPYMNGFVQSRAVGVGGLTDIAVLPVNESSITVTANVSGTVDYIGFLVVGPARAGFYPGL